MRGGEVREGWLATFLEFGYMVWYGWLFPFSRELPLSCEEGRIMLDERKYSRRGKSDFRFQ